VVCKLSIVVPGSDFGGAIINTGDLPHVGDQITLGDVKVEVLEVTELLPPRGDFHFVHATCRLVPADGGLPT
jgi:hypothetical protein